MKLFAIADPHLSGADSKPMDIFGPGWTGHPQKFFSRWREVVSDQDIVIIAGDISWALRLEGAMLDLRAISDLPGEKILLRGNHDYWWPSISRLRAVLPPRMQALQNDSIVIGNTAIVGTRGWDCPGSEGFSNEDKKLYEREILRLKLSLSSLENKKYKHLIIALHFPPTNGRFESNGFTEIIEKVKPDAVVYGHLHSINPKQALTRWKDTKMHYVAVDGVDFYPQIILENI